MNNDNYPTKKIIGWFTLLGGGIGGLLIGLGFITGFLIEWIMYDNRNLTLSDFGNFLAWLVLTFMGGTAIGIFPACICGCIIARRKMTLATNWIYLKLFLIGSSIILVPALIIGMGALIISIGFDLYYSSDFSFISNLKYLTRDDMIIFMPSILGLVSGLTAMILGKFTLPKQ